jgi:arylsulfatase A-like enzyme/parvulin-like peptidyl-prolyl isomerase
MLSTVLSLTVLAARPDLVLVTIDTLRADHVGAYGSKRGATPTLDAMAAQGVVVEDAVVQVPQTRPSHASLLTGLYPFEHGLRDNASPALSAKFQTLATVLAAAGYDTAAFIGAYPVSRASGLARGFRVYGDPFRGDLESLTDDSPNERPANEVVDEALAWLKRPRGAKPLFLWVHMFDPHQPYEPPPPYSTRYAREPYDGEIAFCDAQLKRLFEALDRAGPAGNNRITVVTSDHGEGLGDHGEDEHHLFAYDTTLKVPLIVSGPLLPKGLRVSGQFRSIDLMPTVLELLGVPAPRVTGVSRASNLKSGTVIPQDESYAENLYAAIHAGYAPVRTLRAEGFKFIDLPKAELYRIAEDPSEAANLISVRGPVALAMQKRLREINPEAKGGAPEVALDREAQERLSSLGYVASSGASSATGTGGRPDPKDRVEAFQADRRAVAHALAAFRRNDSEEIIRVLAPLAQRKETSAFVASYLGRALASAGRATEAIPLLERALAANPGAAAPHEHLAEALSRGGRETEALAVVEKGLGRVPSNTALIRRRAVLLVRMGREAEARAGLRAALLRNPKDGMVAAELANLLRNRGELAEADRLSLTAVQSSPRSAEAWLARGLTLGALSRGPEAENALIRAGELDPRNPDALFYRAALMIQRGEAAGSLRLLDQVAALLPGYPGLQEARRAIPGSARPAPDRNRLKDAPGPSGEVHLRLMRFDDREAAAAAVVRLKKGEDFGALARALSRDPSAAAGGDLGPVRVSDLKEPLRSVVKGLGPADVSEVVATERGFVIVKREK